MGSSQSAGSGSRGRVEPCCHLIMAYHPRLLLHEFSVRKDNEVGDAAYVVARGQLGILLGIDFQDYSFTGHLCSSASNFRRGHAAGTTPLRPEINEHGNPGIAQHFVEEERVGCNRFVSRWQGCLACSTTSGVCETRGGDAIPGTALLAALNDGHHRPFQSLDVPQAKTIGQNNPHFLCRVKAVRID